MSLTNLTAMSQSLVEAENSTDEEEEDEVPNLPPAELTEQDTKELLSQLLRQAVTQSAMDSAKREEEYNAAYVVFCQSKGVSARCVDCWLAIDAAHACPSHTAQTQSLARTDLKWKKAGFSAQNADMPTLSSD